MMPDLDSIRLTPFQAAIFDMDGTLLDTEMFFKTIVYEVADELGYVMTHDIHRGMVGSSNEHTKLWLQHSYGKEFSYETFNNRCLEMIDVMGADGVPVKAGAIEFLREIRERGIPTAVATSSSRKHAHHHLASSGLIDLFDTIVTRDDVMNPKPDPEPYLLAAKRLGVDPTLCLALEDSNVGVRAAHAAGMQTIMVPDMVGPDEHIHRLGVSVMESLNHVHRAAFHGE
ncbi:MULTISPECIES: HAD family phosphatase [unclassified Devosia]|uniref:HAD family hydrolase n=1 Tax=unclassified Devosia TaxID=196773 RepID=UPI00145C7AAA|nr:MULTISPECIES: HAD family phosphatase [unclassified Devosia]MBJ6988985.1 HAD family phosphatase [Devosia sp. MC521]QMW62944.1 HAD family phosphatase [Devosia sp. MC521]